MIYWLSELDVDPIITDIFPRAQAQAALEHGLSGDTGKILLRL